MPPHLLLIPLALLSIWILLRRTIVLRRRSLVRNPQAECRRDILNAEQTARGMIQKLELRLYDHSRELEGRLQTRTALLDRLIIEADREIVRMQQMLAELRGGNESTQAARPDILVFHSADSALSEQDVQRARELAGLGLTEEEIARCLERPRTAVRAALSASGEGTRHSGAA